MTDTKRLSLHGRLRMAAACPDPNAALLAEAADAIEQHEAFRQEVSDAIYVDVVAQVRCGIDPKFRTNSVRFVITKPDPLVAALASIDIGLSDHELQKLKDMGVAVTAPARGDDLRGDFQSHAPRRPLGAGVGT